VRLTGNVDLTIDGIRLGADEVVIIEDSGEIKPSGNVRVTMHSPKVAVGNMQAERVVAWLRFAERAAFPRSC
jgi:hypothetical protein